MELAQECGVGTVRLLSAGSWLSLEGPPTTRSPVQEVKAAEDFCVKIKFGCKARYNLLINKSDLEIAKEIFKNDK